MSLKRIVLDKGLPLLCPHNTTPSKRMIHRAAHCWTLTNKNEYSARNQFNIGSHTILLYYYTL